MPQEGAHVHLIDPTNPTSAVKVASGPPDSSDIGLVVHVATDTTVTALLAQVLAELKVHTALLTTLTQGVKIK